MAESLRIAFVGHKTLPANYGGVEVYAEEVGARLADRHHTVLSFTSAVDGDGVVHRGVECRRVGRLEGKHMGALTQALTATVAACRSRVDVVHFMAMGPAIFAPVVRCFSDAAVVVTVAGRDDQRRKWGPVARRLMRLSYRACIHGSDALIGVSRALTDELAPVTRRRCVHIANGVSIPDAASVDLTDLGLGSRPFVLYAGRLVPEKRIEVLLEAFRGVTSDVDLVIAGGPAGARGYESRLHEMAAGDPRIRFLGHRRVEDVDALMRAASLFVLPSELEGLPIALLESTGRGVPVVVSDLPCHREVLLAGGPGARLVPVGDVAALRLAVEAVLMDPTAQLDASARAIRIRQAHCWDEVTRQVENVYRDVLADRRATGRRRARRLVGAR